MNQSCPPWIVEGVGVSRVCRCMWVDGWESGSLTKQQVMPTMTLPIVQVLIGPTGPLGKKFTQPVEAVEEALGVFIRSHSCSTSLVGKNQETLCTKTSQHTEANHVMARLHLLSMAILLPEFILALVTFYVFCSAYPDRYRSRLWSFGGEKGWNSDPAMRIYFYANYEEPPEIPLIWSQK